MVEPTPAAGAPPRSWRWAGALACAAVLAGASPSLPVGTFNWDNVVKLQVARNLLDGLGMVLTEPTPDDAAYAVRGSDGRTYSVVQPLSAMLQVLTLAAAPALAGMYEGIPSLLMLGLVAWALVAWGRASGASPPAAVAGALLATAGTALWPTAALGSDVVIEALALAMILWAGSGTSTWRRWLLAGLTLGAAIATRLGALSLGVSAAVLLLLQVPRDLPSRLRRATVFAAGCAPGLLLVAWYDLYRFGWPGGGHPANLLGSLEARAVPWFSRHHLEGMAGLLVSPGKGILWYSPALLVLAALVVPLARRHGALFAALGAQLVASVLFFGRLRFWHGDWGWGPRYLAPLLVATAPLAWWSWDRVDRILRPAVRARWRATLVLGLVALSALQTLPVTGRPVQAHFFFVVSPLARAGQLVTSPPTRPPVPEDNLILYFGLATSPIRSLWRGLSLWLGDPQVAPLVMEALARAALLPLLAAALILAMERRRRAEEDGAGSVHPG